MAKMSLLDSYPDLKEKIEASFFVKMKMSDSMKSELVGEDMSFDYTASDYDCKSFWINTQFLIYAVCQNRESLMAILFNKLKKKISLHFDCCIAQSEESSVEVKFDKSRKNIFIHVFYKETQKYEEDDDIYNFIENNRKDYTIGQLVEIGYNKAEDWNKNADDTKRKRVTELRDVVDKTAEQICIKLAEDGFIVTGENVEGEKKEDFYHLIRVALAYCFPTKKYSHKSFSAMVNSYDSKPIADGGTQDISCGGEFVLWKQKMNIAILYDFYNAKLSDKELRLQLQYSLYQQDIILKAAHETSKQLRDIVSRKTITAVISTIMSRNMSHNLGSHYLTNTKNYFRNQVDKIIATQHQLSKEIATDYRGNATLLQYIQERMDFIATIISGDQYPLGGLNFKAEFFDILTNDDCGARHSTDKTDRNEKNFLLQYLLYSEHLTRKYGFAEDNSGFSEVELRVNYGGKVYTGKSGRDSNNEEIKNKEQELKNKLSQLRLAVPGGVMARHALFTIVENILRNSAKHNKLNDNKNLVLTIKIIEEDSKYKLFLYDNCGSANILEEMVKKDNYGNELKDENGNKQYEKKAVIEIISNKLENLTIIGKDGDIDKNDKGLKEILISTLWLRNEKLSEKLYDIQNNKEELPLEVLAVNDNGDEIEGDVEGNLCYAITLDKWKEEKELSATEDDYILISKDDFLNIHADFIIAEKDYDLSIKENPNVKKKLSEIFPRFIIKSKKDEMIDSLINGHGIVIEYPNKSEIKELPKGVFHRNDSNWNRDGKNIIFFDHLMNAGKQEEWISEEFNKAEYVDSISGGNFTSTLIQEELLNNRLFRYKVVDSALARIAIVDERIWGDCYMQKKRQEEGDYCSEKLKDFIAKDYKSPQPLTDFIADIRIVDSRMADEIEDQKNTILRRNPKPTREEVLSELKIIINKQIKRTANSVNLLEKKRIGVYTINDDGKILNIDEEEVQSVQCRFVSIHLGLLDKLPKEFDVVKFINEHFMKDDESGRIFISIHSGRGTFSPELDEKLKDYPFISLSALDSAFNNSKYLLSELLNNTNYYGKGNLNY